jgi:predicted metal-dependent HD superfamily phosphohydrolase
MAATPAHLRALHALPASLSDWLTEQYEQPWRAYHNLSHIERMFRVWDSLGGEPAGIDSHVILLAIWFHDAVYDPKRNDNEARSAEEAARRLPTFGVGEVTIARVERVILATAAHHVEEGDPDTALLLDLDLEILGATTKEYEAYSRAIRQEYRFVAEEAYRAGRTQVLTRFLERSRIYRTPSLFMRCEVRARENLEREIVGLRGG